MNNYPLGVTDAMITAHYEQQVECEDCGRLRAYEDEDCECAMEREREEAEDE